MKLTDNTVVISNLNLIYTKIINNNNRIKKLKEMKIKKTFLNKEKIIIQESLDNLLIKSKKAVLL